MLIFQNIVLIKSVKTIKLILTLYIDIYLKTSQYIIINNIDLNRCETSQCEIEWSRCESSIGAKRPVTAPKLLTGSCDNHGSDGRRERRCGSYSRTNRKITAFSGVPCKISIQNVFMIHTCLYQDNRLYFKDKTGP